MSVEFKFSADNSWGQKKSHLNNEFDMKLVTTISLYTYVIDSL